MQELSMQNIYNDFLNSEYKVDISLRKFREIFKNLDFRYKKLKIKTRKLDININ